MVELKEKTIMDSKVYLNNYIEFYRKMKAEAIKRMKERGKVLEVYEECKRKIMEREGYKSESEITEDELYDEKCATTYSCVYEGRHEMLYCCSIVMVRYNESMDDVDVYLESDDAYIAEWFCASEIGFGKDNIYMTILDFID